MERHTACTIGFLTPRVRFSSDRAEGLRWMEHCQSCSGRKLGVGVGIRGQLNPTYRGSASRNEAQSIGSQCLGRDGQMPTLQYSLSTESIFPPHLQPNATLHIALPDHNCNSATTMALPSLCGSISFHRLYWLWTYSAVFFINFLNPSHLLSNRGGGTFSPMCSLFHS